MSKIGGKKNIIFFFFVRACHRFLKYNVFFQGLCFSFIELKKSRDAATKKQSLHFFFSYVLMDNFTHKKKMNFFFCLEKKKTEKEG